MGFIRTLKYRTTTPLEEAGVYTGEAIKTELYNQVRGVVSADKGGTLDVEESHDGTTWIKTNTTSVTGGTPLGFAYDCHAYFARVKYTNGEDAQTSFDLQVYADPFK